MSSLLIFPVPNGIQRIAYSSPLSSKFLAPLYIQVPMPYLPSVFSSLTKQPQFFQPFHTRCSPALYLSSPFSELPQTVIRTELPCTATKTRCWKDGGHEGLTQLTLYPLPTQGTLALACYMVTHRLAVADAVLETVCTIPSSGTSWEEEVGQKPSIKKVEEGHRLNATFPSLHLFLPWWSCTHCGRYNWVKMKPWLMRNYIDQCKTGLGTK